MKLWSVVYESATEKLILVEKIFDMFYSMSYSLSWNLSIFYVKFC